MNILLVEDNPDDVAAVRRLASSCETAVRVRVVVDGDEASRYLAEHAGPLDEPPDLILLDVRMPGIAGIEVLERVRSDSRLSDVPVVMLTSSDGDEDIRAAQDLGAHSYLIKPLSAQDFVWMTRAVNSYRSRLARIGKSRG
jgi:CheY-like chemotaxis protein